MDAAHFVFGAFLGYLWCFARCWIKAPSGRQRFNVLGALNAITYEVITVTNLTYINSESVCQLLRKLVALGLQVPITLVLDNARYQRCALVQSVADALGIELLYLPGTSPLRGPTHVKHLRFFKTEDETEDELRHMGYHRLLTVYPTAHVAAEVVLDLAELGEVFREGGR